MLGIGWYLALCLVVGVGLGLWLDRRWDTGIVLTLIGLLLGLLLAIYGAYEMLIPLLRSRQDNEEDDK